jgi:hypothetical protein
MTQLTDASIAAAAQKAPYYSGGCVMIDVKPFGPSAGMIVPADGTFALLEGEHLGIGPVWDAEARLQGVVGFPLWMTLAPLSCAPCVARPITPVIFDGGGVRARNAPRLPAILCGGAAMELIHRFNGSAFLARLFGRRDVWQWFRVLFSPATMFVGLMANLAPCREAVAMAAVLVKLCDRLILAASRAVFRFHSRSPFLPIISAGMV